MLMMLWGVWVKYYSLILMVYMELIYMFCITIYVKETYLKW
nr:MAG TPA: hypothetical protein [Caudoviricetes sp.]